MKYLKHYWIDVNTGAYTCTENPIEKRHLEAEFPGLDVKAWMHNASLRTLHKLSTLLTKSPVQVL